jgi:LDH2 family malate/lactate/ureidoglycolate dehydrogenase
MLHNSNHLGMLAGYVEEAARRAQIGVAVTISEALVHPWGGHFAMLGTNPLAIAVPAMPTPFVLDMSTGCVSMGQIIEYASRGEALPEGWALDAEGNGTTDALAAMGGSIAPFGGFKGYGLGLAIELLVSGLTGSAIGPDVGGTLDTQYPCNKGDVFICLDPAVLGQGSIVSRSSAYLNLVRTVGGRGGEPVSIPGDRSRALRESRQINGIPFSEALWATIEALQAEVAAQP